MLSVLFSTCHRAHTLTLNTQHAVVVQVIVSFTYLVGPYFVLNDTTEHVASASMALIASVFAVVVMCRYANETMLCCNTFCDETTSVLLTNAFRRICICRALTMVVIINCAVARWTVLVTATDEHPMTIAMSVQEETVVMLKILTLMNAGFVLAMAHVRPHR